MFYRDFFSVAILTAFTTICTNSHATAPTVQILSPKQSKIDTDASSVNILGKVNGAPKVSINGKDAEVYKTTGLFAVDRFPLKTGKNVIVTSARNADGETTTKLEITGKESAPVKPATNKAALAGIDHQSVTPDKNLVMSQGDILQVTFRGKTGMKAHFKTPDGEWFPMTEVRDNNSELNGSNYQGTFAVGKGPKGPSPIEIKTEDDSTSGLSAHSKGTLEIWDPAKVVMLRVKDDGEPLLYGLHEVRLGGPNMAELPAGTLLRAVGKNDKMYRVRLTPTKDAWISAEGVTDAPGEIPPHGYFTSMSVMPNDKGDTVSLAWHKEPFSVSDSVNGSGKAELRLDLYGAHDAATWVTHRSNLKVVKRIWTEQMDSEWLRVHMELNTPVMWGYDVVTSDTSIAVGVRQAPSINSSHPLKGLTIAVEAGHGGKSNIGARGVSGSEEQFVNMNTARALEKELTSKGAKVVQIRVDDENPPLKERARRVNSSNADMLITIHANSGGGNSYFGASGLSDYYKYGFAAPLAKAIHKRILQETSLEDWGVVGNFNYGPIRLVTTMPSMLVEQAFMSNVKDEAMLLDPKVRSRIAKGIRMGMEDFLRDISKQQKQNHAAKEHKH